MYGSVGTCFKEKEEVLWYKCLVFCSHEVLVLRSAISVCVCVHIFRDRCNTDAQQRQHAKSTFQMGVDVMQEIPLPFPEDLLYE